MLRLAEINDENFNEYAIKIYNWQRKHVSIFSNYLNLIDRNHPVSDWTEITCLPISFFKTHAILPECTEAEIIFQSSGTGGSRSKHYVAQVTNYQESFRLNWTNTYGPPAETCILALLPNYINNGDSSLVYMANDLIESGIEGSGFYLNDFENLKSKILFNEANEIPTVLLGVTYALLDFAKAHATPLKNTTIIETGGMKGKRKELPKNQIHQILKNAFSCHQIHSEYGMTELLSQAYSKENGVFHCPPWMRINVREVSDPFSVSSAGKRGGINVVDLANWESCSFVETQDIGVTTDHQRFEILGRLDQADLRGCNLLVADA